MTDQASVRLLYNYDPGTGLFTFLARPRRRAGKVAGNLSSDGYVRIGIDGRVYLAHRVAWLYVTGSWPLADIDHINGNKTDNRFENLRDVSRTSNLQNTLRARSDSSTGLRGVKVSKGRFQASIQSSGVVHHLGTFDRASDAHFAYLAAKRTFHDWPDR